MSETVAGNSSDGSKRIYVLWAAGFAFLGLLAIFCVYFLRPCLEVRAAVRRINAGKGNCEGAVKALGGPEQAAAKCALYVRLPERLATREDKNLAFGILDACGQPAFPWLMSLLGSRDAYVRANAAWTLGKLKDPRAVEPLKALLTNPDSNVRKVAEAAIKKIEGAGP